MLSDEEYIHYSRHIILPQIDEQGQEKLANSRVLIIGIGGLGSAVAMYLAASGVGHLNLADFDQVELSNLQRQIIHKIQTVGMNKTRSAKESLRQLNPYIKISCIEEKVDAHNVDSMVSKVDLVVDCSDNLALRQQINQASYLHQKPLVSGSAIRFEGQLSVFNHKQNSACYQCIYEAGLQIEENCQERGVLSPLVGTIGTLQATEALKILMDIGDVLDSQMLLYDALNMDFRKLKINKKPDCPVCRSSDLKSP